MNSAALNAKISNGKESEQDLWSSLLNSVSSGRQLPEKNIILIGGSPDVQKDFLNTLDSEAVRKPQDRNRRKATIANDFALGFTYQDVLDADHEDILARLSIYTLPEPPDAFISLIKPLLTAKTIPDTLLILLLDWSEPWKWVKQIRDRLRLVKQVLRQVDDDTKQIMEEIMQDWQQRRRGPLVDGTTQNPNEPNITIPLGAGEWDESLGLPLCVVCHGIEKMDTLEKDHTWREEDFDYVLQFLRTILLKHGSSLVYTASTSPNSLPTLVQSTLGIQSLLKRSPLKHNVVDREKILIPPNWDSWGKIRIIREGFDVETLSDGWSLEVQPALAGAVEEAANSTDEEGAGKNANTPTKLYEGTIRDPQLDRQLPRFDQDEDGADSKIASMQDFLASQQPIIEQLKQEDENAANGDPKNAVTDGSGYADGAGRVNEHIGPVQFNMGGIQIDAEDVLQRLRRAREDTPEIEMARTKSTGTSTTTGVATPEPRAQNNEALASFFAGLVKRGTSSSPKPPAA